MEKINFINNSEPAINDVNLNKMQDNTEDAINELKEEQNEKIKITKTNSNTDTYSCDYLNKNIMTLSLLASETFTSTGNYQTKLIPLTLNNSVGDKLIYSNNKIKIGAGVSKIKINAHVVGNNFNVNYTYGATVVKEGQSNSQVAFSLTRPTDSYYRELDISGVLCDVSENDYIALYVYIDQSNTSMGATGSSTYAVTYLTVEVVE